MNLTKNEQKTWDSIAGPIYKGCWNCKNFVMDTKTKGYYCEYNTECLAYVYKHDYNTEAVERIKHGSKNKGWEWLKGWEWDGETY